MDCTWTGYGTARDSVQKKNKKTQKTLGMHSVTADAYFFCFLYVHVQKISGTLIDI